MGTILSIIDESWPPKTKWNLEDVPDLTGKVIIVTGASSGLGKEIAKVLLSRNAKVYIAARDRRKAEEAIAELQGATTATGRAEFLNLDLADLTSVRSAAEEFTRKEKELHVLFNNGGVMATPIDSLTADGYDLQFGTNVLGHFLFTQLLLPTLISTAVGSDGVKGRIVNSSSGAHVLGKLDFKTFKDSPERRKLDPQSLYAQSKYGNVVLALELARRYGDQGIISSALNPGNIRTNLQRHLSSTQAKMIGFMLYPPQNGILTPLWAGTSSEGAGFNGKYLKPWARNGKPAKSAEDPKLGEQLWHWLEEQVE